MQFNFSYLTYFVSMYYYLQILLTNYLNPVFATGAFVIPASFYLVLKVNSNYLYVDYQLMNSFKCCQCCLEIYFVKTFKYFTFRLLLLSLRGNYFHYFWCRKTKGKIKITTYCLANTLDALVWFIEQYDDMALKL